MTDVWGGVMVDRNGAVLEGINPIVYQAHHVLVLGLVPNGPGTQWAWNIMGLVDKGTGTEWAWYTMRLGHNRPDTQWA